MPPRLVKHITRRATFMLDKNGKCTPGPFAKGIHRDKQKKNVKPRFLCCSKFVLFILPAQKFNCVVYYNAFKIKPYYIVYINFDVVYKVYVRRRR